MSSDNIKKSALPEINNLAAEYFDPDNIEQIKESMNKVLSNKNYRLDLINRGKIHCKKYNWEKTVRETINILKNLNELFMGVILGLNCNHADSSACLIKDGKLLVAIEEERINRIKHWAGLPINSIKECLKNSKINVDEITDISINTNPLSNINYKLFYFLKNYLFGKKKYEVFDRLKKDKS